MKQTYIIIDDDAQSTLKTQAVASRFEGFVCVATAANYSDGINVVLEHLPKIVFLEIDPSDKTSNLSLLFINELYRYLKEVPKIIIVTKYKELAFESVKYDVLDYYTKPLGINELRKSILRMEKMKSTLTPEVSKPLGILESAISKDTFSIFDSVVEQKEVVKEKEVVAYPDFAINKEIVIDEVAVNEVSIEISDSEDLATETSMATELPEENNLEILRENLPKEEKPLIICVKSYGDYRFIEAKNICYLQADNNSTDIHMHNGEMITAFKTLKHFEGLLKSPFVRIHNSYIVNIDYVTRIHTGNAVCYIKHTITKIPFSKSYKENVDAIISSISNGNYLEI
jgi:DNA-binding LytR/AlgR family response regulator